MSVGGNLFRRVVTVLTGGGLPDETAAHCEEISHHLERHLGPVPTVLHEWLSEHVHLDVLPVIPTPERPYWTLVTSGMSDRPMIVDGVPDPGNWERAELAMTLPASWADRVEDFQSVRWYPGAVLKMLATIPHANGTWLGPGHTVPLGEPAGPNTSMDGALIDWPQTWPEGSTQLRTSDGQLINFYAVYLLYPEEMEAKLERGSEALLRVFYESGHHEVFTPTRPPLMPDGRPREAQ